MLTVLSIVGTRPEAVKMAPVVRELARYPERVRSVVCSTGQHRELLTPVLNLFEIRPDIELRVMQPDQSLAGLTARLFDALDPVVARWRPDWVLAQGDTTSVLVAGLVAFYRRVRFGHVEAGLRTGDLGRPFPEELNRRVADQVAELLFAPTPRSRDALLREGFAPEQIVVTGNTVVDALQHVAALPYDWSQGPLRTLPQDRQLVLVTAHRRESFGRPLREACLAIRELAHRFGDRACFVYPVHLNPNVRLPVAELLSGLPNVRLIEPLDYLSLVKLMQRSALVLTDSGGIQEEAPTFGVPVLVLRHTTERPEGIEAGAARLVGTDSARIVAEAARVLGGPAPHGTKPAGANPYGDGKAAARIVAALLERG